MARPGTDQANTWQVMDVMELTNALRGIRVCITGHLGIPRDQVKAIIEKAGGSLEDSVRYGVRYLVTNKDWTANSVQGKSNKFRKAEELGVKIISEQQFIDLIVERAEGFTES